MIGKEVTKDDERGGGGGGKYQSWNWVTGHRVSDYVLVGSDIGSKLFTYRPGIVIQFLIEQHNDRADVSTPVTRRTHRACNTKRSAKK